MKFLIIIALCVSFCGTAYAGDEVKVIRMKGQTYKIWTDKNGIRRIDPIYLIRKSERVANPKETSTAEPKGKAAEGTSKVDKEAVKSEQVVESDSGASVVEEMEYETCRESLAAAEAMSSVYNVVFDYPKGQKLTVLLAVDDKTVQLKCEYGTRVTTTWNN